MCLETNEKMMMNKVELRTLAKVLSKEDAIWRKKFEGEKEGERRRSVRKKKKEGERKKTEHSRLTHLVDV